MICEEDSAKVRENGDAAKEAGCLFVLAAVNQKTPIDFSDRASKWM